MPRYHFNVHDDLRGTSPDWEGTEFPDLTVACREAVRFAGATVADNTILNRHGGRWYLEVTDDTGSPLFVVEFLISAAPSTREAATRDRDLQRDG